MAQVVNAPYFTAVEHLEELTYLRKQLRQVSKESDLNEETLKIIRKAEASLKKGDENA